MTGVTPDFKPPPPAEDRVQADALRVAFPKYRVSTIIKGGKVHFEAVAKDAGNPLYCVISTDAKDVWRALKAAA
jgi:hypothetical protein